MLASGSGIAGEKGGGDNTTNNWSTRGKILYYRSKALVAITLGFFKDDDKVKGKPLNTAARDLLQLLSFNPNNRGVTSLLRSVQY